MRSFKLVLLALPSILVNNIVTASSGCKCIPSDTCWPSPKTWASFSQGLSSPSALIQNLPLAISCYSGPLFSPSECAFVDEQSTNATFLATSPVGYDYPFDGACPPLNLTGSRGFGGNSLTCTLGNEPVMTVNATTIEDVINAVNFASKHNLRVAIKNTGHDLLGRSTGFGSLEIWIHYLRLGVTFEEEYLPSPACENADWTGHAYTIRGGYTWSELNTDAAARGVIVVGPGELTLGCLGGWLQGGGHSPASRNFGLGADQLLSAQVVLSNGSLVTASPCQNADLFFAIRGGGGGTYGIVVSSTVKAYPTLPLISQALAIAPVTSSGIQDFMSALAIMYSSYPKLNDQGFSGYGEWSISSPAPIFANFTIGYAHSFDLFNSSIKEAEATFLPVLTKLEALNTSLVISSTYTAFSTFADSISGVSQPVGNANAAVGSRLLDGKALNGNLTALKEMLNVTAGTADEGTSTNICLVGGGQVFKDVTDPFSGVNPAWRRTYLHNIVNRGWAAGTDAATIQEIRNDITFGKVGAMKKLAPDTGSYMNEADRFDQEYLEDFYGLHASRLGMIKRRYDPDNLFYCPTCVGSEFWEENEEGALCPT